MSEVLTRDYGIANNISANGRQYRVISSPLYPGLFEVAYGDGKGGELPAKLKSSRYTSKQLAQRDITKFVTEYWDMSDSNKAKSKKE